MKVKCTILKGEWEMTGKVTVKGLDGVEYPAYVLHDSVLNVRAVPTETVIFPVGVTVLGL